MGVEINYLGVSKTVSKKVHLIWALAACSGVILAFTTQKLMRIFKDREELCDGKNVRQTSVSLRDKGNRNKRLDTELDSFVGYEAPWKKIIEIRSKLRTN